MKKIIPALAVALLICSAPALAGENKSAIEKKVTGILKEIENRKTLSFFRDEIKTLSELGAPAVDALMKAVKEGLETKEKERSGFVAEEALEKFTDLKAVKPLTKWLKDKNIRIRILAITVIGNLRSKEGIEPLLPLLEDKEAAIRVAVTEALGDIGDKKASKALEKRLKDAELQVRRKAIESLSRIGDTAYVTLFITMLGDVKEDAKLREMCAFALGNLKDKRATKALCGILLDGKNPKTFRATAANSLEKIKDPEAVPSLSKVAKDKTDDKSLRLTAIRAMGVIAHTSAKAVLLEIMNGSEKKLSQRAAFALLNLGDRNLREKLAAAFIKMLDEEDDATVKSALNCLGRMRETKARKRIVSLLTDEDRKDRVRQTAVKALGKIGGTWAMDNLVPILQDDLEDTITRAYAAEALGDIGNPIAVPALIEALNARDDWIRRKSAIALGKIGDKKASKTLKKVWEKDTDEKVRLAAAFGLYRTAGNKAALEEILTTLKKGKVVMRRFAVDLIGETREKRFIPLLAEALYDEDPYSAGVAMHACWALRQITGEKIGEDVDTWKKWCEKNAARYKK
ncbi:MAG: hypothetical protein E3J72_02455 [Planctomycetota bacterium]|nr:MAG: hypothetical protein E3J72_02455 [Planctomycetota bacterium]